MKPVIALLGEINSDQSCSIKNTYVRAVEKSGGIPLLVPYLENGAALDGVVSVSNGFLFVGGDDIDPALYGEELSTDKSVISQWRDKLDFALVSRVLKSGKPAMFICRGAQLLNVALGGTLFQDIPTDFKTDIQHRQKEPKGAPSHKIKIVPGSPLHTLVGEHILANSHHHQAIKVLGENLHVMATAPDGIIEAIYCEGNQSLRAYQWHPELLIDKDDGNEKIFSDFLAAAEKTIMI